MRRKVRGRERKVCGGLMTGEKRKIGKENEKVPGFGEGSTAGRRMKKRTKGEIK